MKYRQAFKLIIKAEIKITYPVIIVRLISQNFCPSQSKDIIFYSNPKYIFYSNIFFFCLTEGEFRGKLKGGEYGLETQKLHIISLTTKIMIT